jgi:hypothetical protein
LRKALGLIKPEPATAEAPPVPPPNSTAKAAAPARR